ncbi:O-antigen ligase family protein [Alteromonas macleodii]|uniref:O-antigen ligase family protein n=1 Tax=Alteromonas macleodii TaxID=28108 RepID=UPI00068A3B8D|nr:O-antigen ligase family protein [Alteromonas macleodii]
MLNVIFFFSLFPVAGILSAKRSLAFLFVLYQFIYFVNPQTKWWRNLVPDLSYSFYIVLILLIITILKWPRLENKIWKSPPLIYLTGIGLLYLAASPYAVFPLIHNIAVDAIITAVIIVLLVYKLCDTPDFLSIIMKGYVFSATYMGYYITQFGRTSGGRYSGGGMVDAPDENAIAAAIAPALILCGYYIWREAKSFKIIYLLCAGLLANGLVQIGSRGSFLGVAVGAMLFFVFLYFSKAQVKSQKAKVAGMVLVALSAIPFVTDSLFWERFFSINEQKIEQTEKESGATRIYFWKAAVAMSFDYPFGTGASGFIYHSPNYIDENVNTGKSRNRAVHSTWFEVLSEIGYPGFLCVLALIVKSFSCLKVAARECHKRNDVDGAQLMVALGCAFVSFLVAITFLNRIRAEILYWLVLFIACAYNLYVIKPGLKENLNREGKQKGALK